MDSPKERLEKFEAKFNEARRQFLAKEITEDVLRATLFSIGFRHQDLNSQVNLILMEERDAKKRKTRSMQA